MFKLSQVLNDNDNDKRLGLTAKADQPDHKKYSWLFLLSVPVEVIEILVSEMT